LGRKMRESAERGLGGDRRAKECVAAAAECGVDRTPRSRVCVGGRNKGSKTGHDKRWWGEL